VAVKYENKIVIGHKLSKAKDLTAVDAQRFSRYNTERITKISQNLPELS